MRRWRGRDALNDRGKMLDLSVECLCFPIDPTAKPDGLDAVQSVVRGAKSFLREHREQAIPRLVKYIESRCAPPGTRDSGILDIQAASYHRTAHATDLLAEFQDRRVVLPLLRAVLTSENPVLGPEYAAARTIARIGDSDVAPLLIEAYPYEDELQQDLIAFLLGITGSPPCVQALIDWSTSNANRDPPDHVRHALIHTGDVATKDALIELLFAPGDYNHRDRVRAALERLNVSLAELPIPDWMPKSFQERSDRVQLLPEPDRFPLVYEDPNPPLRKFMRARIREKATLLAAGRSEEGLRLALIPSRTDIRVQETISWMTRLTNTGGKPVSVVLGRDAWESGTELPRISVEAIGPDCRRFHLVPRCPFYRFPSSANPQIAMLAAGQSCDLIADDSLVGFSLARFRPTVPGLYRFKLHYDSKHESGGKPPVDGALGVRLASRIVEILVRPGDDSAASPQDVWHAPEAREYGMLESYFAWRWNRRNRLPTAGARIGAAIHCLRYCEGGPHGTFDAEMIAKCRTDAHAFLKAEKETAVPQLLDVLPSLFKRQPEPVRYLSSRFLWDYHGLLGAAGDRRAVLPLTETLLSIPFRGAADYPEIQAMSWALKQLGDADLIQGLLAAYPYETPPRQRVIFDIACKTEGVSGAMGLSPDAEVLFTLLQEDHQTKLTRFKLRATEEMWALHSRVYPLRNTKPHPELREYLATRLTRLKAPFVDGITEDGLELQVSVSPPVIELGDDFTVTVGIKNVSEHTRTVIRSRPESDRGRTMPAIDVEIRGPDHRPLEFMPSHCGATALPNPLRKSDLVQIEPGESYEVVGHGAAHHHRLHQFYPGLVGTYRIQATYCTQRRDGRVVGRRSRPPEGVAGVELVSPAVELRVLSAEQAVEVLGHARPDARAAEWMLDVGGAVQVEYGKRGNGRWIEKKKDLQSTALRLVAVRIHGNDQVTDESIEHLRGLRQLRQLDLTGSPVTNAGVERLTGLESLLYLTLRGTLVKSLSLPAMPQLKNLLLDDTPLARIHIKDAPNLAFIGLENTDVVPGDLEKLRHLSSRPNVKFVPRSKSPAGETDETDEPGGTRGELMDLFDTPVR